MSRDSVVSVEIIDCASKASGGLDGAVIPRVGVQGIKSPENVSILHVLKRQICEN